MSAGTWDTGVEQGATWTRTITVTQAGVPVTLAAPVWMEVRSAPGGALVKRLDAAGGQVALSGGNQTVTLTLTATETRALAAGQYVHDLYATLPGGAVLRLLAGAFVVTAAVSVP